MTNKDFRFGISSSIAGVDLNQLLVAHPASTFFMRVADDVPEFEIYKEDVVVVDRSLDARSNDVVVVETPGESVLSFARFQDKPDSVVVWGVVNYVIRKLHVS